MLKSYPGYEGVFTRNEYPDAYPNGTRIMKTVKEPDDTHDVGALGTVLGSIGEKEVGYGYFVEWDDMPAKAIFVMSHRVSKA